MLLHCGWEGNGESKGQRVPLAQRSDGGMRVVSAAAGMSDHLGYVMRCISHRSLEGGCCVTEETLSHVFTDHLKRHIDSTDTCTVLYNSCSIPVTS